MSRGAEKRILRKPTVSAVGLILQIEALFRDNNTGKPTVCFEGKIPNGVYKQRRIPDVFYEPRHIGCLDVAYSLGCFDVVGLRFSVPFFVTLCLCDSVGLLLWRQYGT